MRADSVRCTFSASTSYWYVYNSQANLVAHLFGSSDGAFTDGCDQSGYIIDNHGGCTPNEGNSHYPDIGYSFESH